MENNYEICAIRKRRKPNKAVRQIESGKQANKNLIKKNGKSKMNFSHSNTSCNHKIIKTDNKLSNNINFKKANVVNMICACVYINSWRSLIKCAFES